MLGGLKTRDSLTPPRRDLLTPPRATLTPPRSVEDNENKTITLETGLTSQYLEKLSTEWRTMTRTLVLTVNSQLQVGRREISDIVGLRNCFSDIRLEYWDINELSPLSTPAVSRSPSPFDFQDFR